MPSLFLLYRDSLSQSGSGGYTDQLEQPFGDNHSQLEVEQLFGDNHYQLK